MSRVNFTNSAFSLVEVTLALGVAAFCLIAVLGLMPAGVQTNRNATSQTAATNIIASVIADMRALASTIIELRGTGQFTTSLGANSRYRVSITFPSSPAGLSYADVKATWPAPAISANASGSSEIFAAFDRN